jgi:MFS family permease
MAALNAEECCTQLVKPTVLVIALGATANALNQADRNLMPIAIISMAAELGFSLMQRGLVLSAFALGYICAQLPSGFVATKVQPLRLLHCAVLFWSLMTLATAAAARIGLSLLLLTRVLMGVAEGFCLPAIFTLFAAHVPRRRRSLAFSLMLGCGSVGQLLSLLISPHLEPWERSFMLFGGAGLVWCGACVVLRPRLRRPATPGDVDDAAPHDRAAAAAEAEAAMELTRDGRGRGANDTADFDEAAHTVVGGGCAVLWRLIACPAVLAICAAHFSQNYTNCEPLGIKPGAVYI